VYRVGERLSRDRLQDGGDAAVQVTWLRILCMPMIAAEACGEVRRAQHCCKWASGEGGQRSGPRLCLRHWAAGDGSESWADRKVSTVSTSPSEEASARWAVHNGHR